MHRWIGLTCLRRHVGLLTLTPLFAAWMPSGGALAAAPVPAPAVAGVERFAIDSSASQALYRVGVTFFNRNNQFTVAVGTTHGVQGQILVDRAHPSQSRIGPMHQAQNQVELEIQFTAQRAA